MSGPESLIVPKEIFCSTDQHSLKESERRLRAEKKAAPSLTMLKIKYEEMYPEYIKWGIHVMASQNQTGELTIGDSHEYGLTPDPFNKQFINQLILDYLKQFARFGDEHIIETWNGIYPKLTNGAIALVLYPEEGVAIINGLGGAGMTLSFGLCEQLIAEDD